MPKNRFDQGKKKAGNGKDGGVQSKVAKSRFPKKKKKIFSETKMESIFERVMKGIQKAKNLPQHSHSMKSVSKDLKKVKSKQENKRFTKNHKNNDDDEFDEQELDEEFDDDISDDVIFVGLREPKKKKQKSVKFSEQIESKLEETVPSAHYDSDESDIIDDMAEDLENKGNHKRKRMERDDEALIMDNDIYQNTAIFIDDSFFTEMEDRENPDDRLIKHLEKKLGIAKKKKKQQKKEGLESEEKGNLSKKSELQRLVEEKRMKKKMEKLKGQKIKGDEVDDEIEVENPNFEHPDDIPEIASDYDPDEDDGLDAILDNLSNEGGDDNYLDKNLKYNDEEEDINRNNESVNEDSSDNSDIEDDSDHFEEYNKSIDSSEDNETIENGEDNADDTDIDMYKSGRNQIEQTNDENSKSSTTKYIPPHLRKNMSSKDTEKDKRYIELQKSIRGIVNKISQENLVSMTKKSLELFDSNSKNDFCEIISDAVLDSICNNINLSSNFILLYATYVVAMHNIGGMQIGAYFLEKLVQKFDEFAFKKKEKKISTNLLMLIAHFFNMKMIYGTIIHDIVRELCNDLTEFHVELVYKLLRTCGFKLRSEDAVSLKSIVDLVQQKVKEMNPDVKNSYQIKAAVRLDHEQMSNIKENTDESMDPKRFQYMLEIINDIKNNRQRKSHKDEQEKYNQFNKMVKQMQRDSSKSGEYTLRIPYKDALYSNKKGRWWLVGSAWAGPQASEGLGPIQNDDDNEITTSHRSIDDEFSKVLNHIPTDRLSKLEKLARSQRMTTDLRRTIFIILMSSEDDVDAFQNLAKLGLKKYDREIIRIIFHCCFQEKLFNPYYALILQRMCGVEKSYERTCQFVFYEHYNQFESYPVRKLINLSRLTAALLQSNNLSLSMFKIVDFSNLSSQQLFFFRLLFVHILLENDDTGCARIASRIVRLEHCQQMKETLSLFMYQFINKDFRRGFIYDLLAVRDVTKKEDDTWQKENERIISKKAKKMKKIFSLDPADFEM